MNELLDAIIQKLKDEGGELPDIHLIAMELVATSEDGIECRVQGGQLTKDLLEDLEISNEELDRMLRPAAACLKGCDIRQAFKNIELRDNCLLSLSKYRDFL